MDNIRLEPYAAKLRMRRLANDPEISFRQAVVFLIEHMAQGCMLEKGALIGHIKGFAAGPCNSYIRVSLTDARRPAESEGKLSGRPESIDVTLNAHVIGLPADTVKQRLVEAMADLASSGRVSTAFAGIGE